MTEPSPSTSVTQPGLAETQDAPDDSVLQRAISLVGQDWLDVVNQPISQAAPAGDNVRLEPLFEQIEAEIAKLDSLTNDAPVEWDLMINWCRDILREQSKDILVACYLARALCEANLLQGLITGTLIQLELAKNFWDNGFPPQKRARGRAAAYNWWIEQCAPLLDKFQFNIGHLANVQLLLALLQALDAFLL